MGRAVASCPSSAATRARVARGARRSDRGARPRPSVAGQPGNLVQTTLIAYRMQQHYAELRAQYLTILRMGQGLGNLDRFRGSPTIPITAHDPSRWDFGRPWIQGLNSGDATGAAYLSTTLPLLRPMAPPTLTAAGRRVSLNWLLSRRLKRTRTWGLTNRRGKLLTSQAIGMLLRNQLYAGIVDVPEYGVRGRRGDFEPLIREELFYRVQGILSGRVPSTAPRKRAHPNFCCLASSDASLAGGD